MNELDQLKLRLETVKAKKMLIVKSSNYSQVSHLKQEEKSILDRIRDFRSKESKEA
ncbi:hypothetical protein [Halocola ammonii]